MENINLLHILYNWFFGTSFTWELHVTWLHVDVNSILKARHKASLDWL